LLQQFGQLREPGQRRQLQRVTGDRGERRLALPPGDRQMAPRRLVLLLGAVTVEFGLGQRRLCGQHHRLRRGTGLQPLACRLQCTLALLDIDQRDAAALLGDGHRQIPLRHVRQQVQAHPFAFRGQCIDACLRQCPAGVELAAAFQHSGQADGQFGAVQATVVAAAKGVFQLRAEGQRGAQCGHVALGGQHGLPTFEQAQFGMGMRHTAERGVQAQ
jgi:hypothetical protein